MYLKRILETVVIRTKLLRERRRKPTELKAWNSVTKHELSRIEVERVSLQRLHSLEPMSFSVITACGPGFPEFQELIWDLEETTRRDRNSEAGRLCFQIYRVLSLFWKTMTEQALPPASCYWKLRPEFSPNLSANSGDAPSKVNYGTCHFPKRLFLYHLCTLVHALFLYPGVPSSASSSVKTAISSISNSDAVFHESLNLRQKLTF